MSKHSRKFSRQPDPFESFKGQPVDLLHKNLKELDPVKVKKIHKKIEAEAVFLSANHLKHLHHFDEFLKSVLTNPKDLTWLDLSHNKLSTVDDCLLNYPQLKIIYFHDNKIQNLREIEKLSELKNLRSVSFLGCPVASNPQYKHFIINALPQVEMIDFRDVRDAERRRASTAPSRILKRFAGSEGSVSRLRSKSNAHFQSVVKFINKSRNSLERTQPSKIYRPNLTLGSQKSLH